VAPIVPAEIEVPAEPHNDAALTQIAQTQAAFAQLRAHILEYRPNDDLTPVERAFSFADERHKGQRRASGEPYMSHPLAVADILASMRMDVVSIETGLLHDVLEDTASTSEEIRKQFGEEVARCVDGVTKLNKLDFSSAEDAQSESYRKMLLAMVSDIRVMIVKLADRLHNMRTLGALSRERQERIAHETVEIYAPIAHRLGMGKVRGELEDLAFRHLDPEAFEDISNSIDAHRLANEAFLASIKNTVEEELREEGIPARVEGRVKRAYSVYQKLKRQKITIDQVYDLLALRIITDSVKNCYAALGVIHNQWRPVPGRIKDHIAIPRPNFYQSLHTSVVGPEGRHFEVQIRTEEMHRLAEEGIAAHWKYKEGRKPGSANNRGPSDDDQRIAWLRHLVEWQQDMKNSSEFLDTLKVDLYADEVHTFTPRGRVIALPKDATPVDFAYAIHSDIGNTCYSAKVNGKAVPLRYTLQNGDTVEIITQSNQKPSRDWLSFVKTAKARNKIRHLINAEERNKAIEIGQKYLDREARRCGIYLNRAPREQLQSVAADYGYGKMEDLYAALGFGRFSARQVLQKMVPGVAEPEPAAEPPAPVPYQPRDPAGEGVVKVSGADQVLVYRAKCCNPIRGEAIVGYVTRGKGVAVHSRQCSNVQKLMFDAERKIDVAWEGTASAPLPVRLVVHTDDRPGLLNQLTSILSSENANIRSLEAKTEIDATADALIEMTIDVRDKKQLEKLVSSMRRISGIRDVERLFQ
jgi:guanosine-3',5'-bis(diphosphate) 3'-pyrophosphohydrolase